MIILSIRFSASPRKVEGELSPQGIGTEIAQGGVLRAPAPTTIREAFDIKENIAPGLLACGPEQAPIIILIQEPAGRSFQGAPSTFHDRIVIAVARAQWAPAHAGLDVVLLDQSVIVMTGILGAAVGRVEQISTWFAGLERHLQGLGINNG
jgi:hypothetical protein